MVGWVGAPLSTSSSDGGGGGDGGAAVGGEDDTWLMNLGLWDRQARCIDSQR